VPIPLRLNPSSHSCQLDSYRTPPDSCLGTAGPHRTHCIAAGVADHALAELTSAGSWARGGTDWAAPSGLDPGTQLRPLPGIAAPAGCGRMRAPPLPQPTAGSPVVLDFLGGRMQKGEHVSSDQVSARPTLDPTPLDLRQTAYRAEQRLRCDAMGTARASRVLQVGNWATGPAVVSNLGPGCRRHPLTHDTLSLQVRSAGQHPASPSQLAPPPPPALPHFTLHTHSLRNRPQGGVAKQPICNTARRLAGAMAWK
jgi:hypothetical protein